MLASKLDRRILIERRTASTDEFGGPTETFAPLATVWAAVKEADGREFLASGSQIVAEQKAVFTIRFRMIETTDRVVYGGRIHDIQSTREIARRAALEIHTISRA